MKILTFATRLKMKSYRGWKYHRWVQEEILKRFNFFFYLSSKTCLALTRQVYQNILTSFLKTKFGWTLRPDSFYLDNFLLVGFTYLLDFDRVTSTYLLDRFTSTDLLDRFTWTYLLSTGLLRLTNSKMTTFSQIS